MAEKSSRHIGPLWTREEDRTLLLHVAAHGTRQWRAIAKAGLLPGRGSKACCNRFIVLKRNFFKRQKLSFLSEPAAQMISGATAYMSESMESTEAAFEAFKAEPCGDQPNPFPLASCQHPSAGQRLAPLVPAGSILSESMKSTEGAFETPKQKSTGCNACCSSMQAVALSPPVPISVFRHDLASVSSLVTAAAAAAAPPAEPAAAAAAASAAAPAAAALEPAAAALEPAAAALEPAPPAPAAPAAGVCSVPASGEADIDRHLFQLWEAFTPETSETSTLLPAFPSLQTPFLHSPSCSPLPMQVPFELTQQQLFETTQLSPSCSPLPTQFPLLAPLAAAQEDRGTAVGGSRELGWSMNAHRGNSRSKGMSKSLCKGLGKGSDQGMSSHCKAQCLDGPNCTSQGGKPSFWLATDKYLQREVHFSLSKPSAVSKPYTLMYGNLRPDALLEAMCGGAALLDNFLD